MTVPSFDYRCRSCLKLLCKGFLVEGDIEIKCRSCHAITHIKAELTNALICLKGSCPNRQALTPGPHSNPT